VPAAHGVHAVAAAAEYVPATQATHEAPDLKVPALQVVGEQDVWPTAEVLLPAAQAVHDVALPAAAIEPTAQLVQAFDPEVEEYWPAKQLMHWVPLAVSL